MPPPARPHAGTARDRNGKPRCGPLSSALRLTQSAFRAKGGKMAAPCTSFAPHYPAKRRRSALSAQARRGSLGLHAQATTQSMLRSLASATAVAVGSRCRQSRVGSRFAVRFPVPSPYLRIPSPFVALAVSTAVPALDDSLLTKERRCTNWLREWNQARYPHQCHCLHANAAASALQHDTRRPASFLPFVHGARHRDLLLISCC